MAKYQDAVDWIALNDEPGSDGHLDETIVSELVSVAFVADLWDKDPRQVARDIIKIRTKFSEVYQGCIKRGGMK